MADPFRYLFTPLKIGSVTVKNRIVFLPHVTVFGENHVPTERTAAYLAERAKGGAGLIISESSSVHPHSLALMQLLAAFDERAIPHFRRVTERVHENGAKIFGQIAHSGRQTSSVSSRVSLWAPSAVPSGKIREIPHAMTVPEIREVVEGFAKSASHFKAAGYDGIELHGAHGYLIEQFMSPFTNRRTDAYGGSLENRLRFGLEVIDAVRKRIGDQIVLGIRLSGDELVPGGLTLDDMQEIAARLEATGQLDYMSLSIGVHETQHIMIGDMSIPLGAAVYVAAGIKQVVRLPVLTALRINDPVQAEQILADGQADLIGMARALICDPELPNKAREGRLDDIRKCMACSQDCRGDERGVPISCTINPTAGYERELGIGTIKSAAARKKVVVVGGGPGGLEAARVAAMRGHKVTLYERSSELGGQVNLATKVPSRNGLEESIRYLGNQVRKLGVDIKFRTEATADSILQEKPDAVVVATGSVPFMKDIPGAAGGRLKITNVREVLEGSIDTGDRAVVFDFPEGFWQCIVTAEFLALQGKNVTLVTPLPSIGMGLPLSSTHNAFERLLTNHVTLITNCDIKAIKDKRLTIFNVLDHQEQHLENIDSLVLSLGGKANDALYHALMDHVKEIYLVGDAVAPRKISAAVREGHLAGRRI